MLIPNLYRYLLPAVLVLVLGSGRSLTAATVVDFEQGSIPMNADGANVGSFSDRLTSSPDGFEGQDISSTFSSGVVTFSNTFNTTWNSWSGFGVSQRNLDAWSSGAGFQEFSNHNDTVSASGAGVFGSQTWAVAFGTAFDGTFLAVMEADNGYEFESLYVNNTQTTNHLLINGNAFTDGFGSRSQDESFAVRFYDLSPGASGEQYVERSLASYHAASQELQIVDEWTRVDLRSLGGATRIGVDFVGTDVTTFNGQSFLNTPAYVAIDNISLVTAIPEPGGLALVAGIAAVICLRRVVHRRRGVTRGSA